MNNGTSSDMVNGFNCICITGYTGIICNVEILECASNPCESIETCSDLIGYFTCDSIPGYTSDTCMTPILVVTMEVALI